MSSGRKSPTSRVEFNEGEKAKKTQFGNILEQIDHFVEQLGNDTKWIDRENVLSKTIMESMNCFDENEEDMATRIESKKFQHFSPYYQYLEQSQRDIDNLEVSISPFLVFFFSTPLYSYPNDHVLHRAINNKNFKTLLNKIYLWSNSMKSKRNWNDA